MCHSTMFAMLCLDALGVGGCGFVEHVVICALQWRVGSVGSRSLPQGIVSGGGVVNTRCAAFVLLVPLELNVSLMN